MKALQLFHVLLALAFAGMALAKLGDGAAAATVATTAKDEAAEDAAELTVEPETTGAGVDANLDQPRRSKAGKLILSTFRTEETSGTVTLFFKQFGANEVPSCRLTYSGQWRCHGGSKTCDGQTGLRLEKKKNQEGQYVASYLRSWKPKRRNRAAGYICRGDGVEVSKGSGPSSPTIFSFKDETTGKLFRIKFPNNAKFAKEASD